MDHDVRLPFTRPAFLAPADLMEPPARPSSSDPRTASDAQPQSSHTLALVRPARHRSRLRQALAAISLVKNAYATTVRVWRLHGVVRHHVLSYHGAEWLARASSHRILHCFGDSHALAFRVVGRDRRLLPSTWFDVVAIPGATASGLANPNSRTNALATYLRCLARLDHDSRLLFLLGEVDCGFLLWLKAGDSKLQLANEFESCIGRYTSFLEGVLDQGFRNVIVATVPLPTIVDYNTWAGLQGARSLIAASIHDRTALTRLFNQRIREWCGQHNCMVLDYEDRITDPATGLVRSDLLDSKALDHHLQAAKFSDILASELRGLGFN